MRFPPHNTPAVVDAKDGPNAVTACPFCASDRVTTTNTTLTTSTYWRCHGCGEIWNPARAKVAAPFRRPRW
jgi:transposase-like protein